MRYSLPPFPARRYLAELAQGQRYGEPHENQQNHRSCDPAVANGHRRNREVGETTGVKLRLDPARSNGNFRVFRGCGDSNGAIAEVECRTTRVKGAAKGTLIYVALNERLAPTGSDVTSRLGKPHSIQQATGSAIYAYQVPGGELRFAVKAGSPDAVLSIALEKTPSVQSAASRAAKWGSADLTPVSS